MNIDYRFKTVTDLNVSGKHVSMTVEPLIFVYNIVKGKLICYSSLDLFPELLKYTNGEGE